MDIFLRVIAIFVEVAILVAIMYCLLIAARLIFFDLGLKPKYMKVIVMALVVAGSLVVIFFIAHLTTFYPAI